MKTRAQAKDISDTRVLDSLRATVNPWGTSLLEDVQNALSDFPPKVVRAKLSSLIRRKVIDGCTCGCRGDFEILHQGRSMRSTFGR